MATNKSIVAGVSVLVAAGVIAILLMARRSSARELALGNDIEAMRAEVAAMRNQTAKLAMATPLALAPTAPPAASMPPAAPSESDEAAGKPAPAKDQGPTALQIEAHVGKVFAAEGTDGAWSQPAAHTITTEVAKRLPPGTAVHGVDCRKTLCRVRATHPNVDSYQKFMEEALFSRDNGLWNAAMSSLIVEQSEGAVQTVTYIAREGENIPQIPEP